MVKNLKKEKELTEKLDKQKEYFNKHAKTWDQNVFHDPEKIKKIIFELKLKSGDKVLDVGSGTGIMIPYLFNHVNKSGKIIALDYSKKMIEISKKKHPLQKFPNLMFVLQDINSFSLEGEYDAILCYSCFPHFLNKNLIIQKLTKGLKKGGKLMIAHSQSRKIINKLHKKSNGVVSKDRLPSIHRISKMMENSGLKILKTVNNEEMFFIIGKK